MDGEARRLRAALWLVTWFAWRVWVPGGVDAAACAEPVSESLVEGRTTAVRCDGRGAPLRGAAKLLYGGRLDPNHDDAASLAVLPGLGPARAAAVVEARRAGRYERVEDLGRVRGIGETTIERLRPWLVFGDPGPVASPDGGK